MVRGIGKEKRKSNPLLKDKNYLLEAWLQAGKAMGSLFSKQHNKKQSKNKK
jgi:hypothetical protein